MATLKEFNASLEKTKDWVNELTETLGTDEMKACRVFRVTLHALRDHLTVEEGADLASQLPLLFKGIFYEGWKPKDKLGKRISKEELVTIIADTLGEDRIQGERRVRDVFLFLDHRISPGEVSDIVGCLPKEWRNLWPKYIENRPLASLGR